MQSLLKATGKSSGVYSGLLDHIFSLHASPNQALALRCIKSKEKRNKKAYDILPCLLLEFKWRGAARSRLY